MTEQACLQWGLVNFDASTLWVRDRTHLTDALDVTPPFLRTKEGDAGTVIDYRNWHLSLGRRFRSLKLWFVLRSFGVKGFQKYIRRTISLGNQFADLVRTSDKLRLVTPPSFALTVFRMIPKHEAGTTPFSDQSLNDLNRILHEQLANRQDIMLTQTALNGVFCIRLAVGAARTEPRHIQAAFELISAEADIALQLWEERGLDKQAATIANR
jgi:aromatic-L-amino-acid/L-tryptophan decarboxylase